MAPSFRAVIYQSNTGSLTDEILNIPAFKTHCLTAISGLISDNLQKKKDIIDTTFTCYLWLRQFQIRRESTCIKPRVDYISNKTGIKINSITIASRIFQYVVSRILIHLLISL